MKIVVAGAGAFGTALAIATAPGNDVTLLGRSAPDMAAMADTRINTKRLPDIQIPESIDISSDAGTLDTAEIVLLAVRMQSLADYLHEHRTRLSGKCLVACCKGLDLTRLTGPADIIAEVVPNATPLVLSGPAFAADIAVGRPTAMTLACQHRDLAKTVQTALSGSVLRLYRSGDVMGTQLGGALKNVIAIAAGATMGAGLGDSARAALITRGFAEMQMLTRQLGAQPDTLMGLSGLGDLILTCSSEQSRNFSFGLALGQGAAFDPGVTVEGAATAQALVALATRDGVDMPISAAVDTLVRGQADVREAIQSLLARPLRAE